MPSSKTDYLQIRDLEKEGERWQGERERVLRKASHQYANGEERYRCREGMTWLAGLKREAVSSRWHQWERGGGNDTSQVEKQKARAAWPTLARHNENTHLGPGSFYQSYPPSLPRTPNATAVWKCHCRVPLLQPGKNTFWQEVTEVEERLIAQSVVHCQSSSCRHSHHLIELHFLKHPLNYI